MTLRNRNFAAAALFAALTMMLAPAAARADTVGTAAAVKPASTGTPPGSGARTLKAGTNIVDRERIKTSGSGSLQVMFLDKTTMTIGPNSDVVIDEFVYRPGGGGNQFVASMTKGALRFVGGQISHNQGATITTPTATIGIRGGVALVTHDAKCQNERNRGKQCTKVVCIRGACSVKSLVDARNFQLRVNQAVEIGMLGATQPFNVTSVKLNDVAKGGDAGITSGKSAASTTTFGGTDAINQTVSEQQPEPAPPPPPGPGPDDPPPPPPPPN
jgi:hypothetical protein